MSDLKELKKRIYEDERIEEILNSLGCNNIHSENGLFVASLPNGSNKRSVQVRNNEHLSAHIRSRGIRGDIFAIVSYIKFDCTSDDEIMENLSDAKMWLIETFGYHDVLQKNKGKKKDKVDWNDWLHNLKKKRAKQVHLEDLTPNNPIEETVRNNYLMLPYNPWIEEGISWDTQMEWEVGFDWVTKRVVTLVRGITGDLIGVKGRALDDLDERKYMYIEKMNKSIELFGLHKTLPYILESKEIILFEGYKSVMKAWQMGYRNCASIEGDDISQAQVQIIKSLGLDVKTVVCYDKDKSEEEIKDQISKFKNRKVYYTYDFEGLLRGKDSPVDKGEGIWKELYLRKTEFIA